MGSVAEQPKKKPCKACAQLTERYAKYLNDRLCNKCAAVLWAAQALLDNDYGHPQEIIPTVVFAAVSAEDHRLEDLAESLATNEWESEQARRLRDRFAWVFEGHSIWTFVDGIPVIRQDPIQLGAIHKDGDKDIERIIIDMVDVSAKPEQVAERYKGFLDSLGLDASYTEEIEEGEIGWQIGPGIIHMIVYPSLVDPDLDSILRSLRRTPHQSLSFPPPALVGEMYSVLRGSNAKGRFPGFGRSVLPGNLTKSPSAKTLIPACVAWYLAGRKKPSDKGTRIKISELLNRHLLIPCGLESLSQGGSDFIQLWRDVGRRADALNSAEQAFVETLQRHECAPDYWSPSENK
jgi:hypothetical protein